MMRLLSLTVRSAPGLPDGVELASLAPGLNLILGPNASGKSTLVRAFRNALWAAGKSPGILAEIVVEDPEGRATATLAYGRTQWRPEPPSLPPAEVRALLALDLASLLAAGRAEDRFSRRVAVDLAAGYDLVRAQESLQAPSHRAGQLQTALKAARTRLRQLESQAGQLASREEKLEQLRFQLHEARRARELARLAAEAAELAKVRDELDRLSGELAGLPPCLDALRNDDGEELQRLQSGLSQAEEEIEKLDRRRREDGEAARRLQLPGSRPASHEIEAWRQRIRHLTAIERELGTLRTQLGEARAREEEARAGLGSWQPPAAGLPEDALAAMESALNERERLRAQLEQAGAAVEQWETDARAADPSAAQRLGRGIDALRAWLRTAPVEHLPAWPGWLAAALGGLAMVLALSGVEPDAAVWLLRAGILLLGAGAGIVGTLAVVRRRAGGTPLAEAREAAGQAGLVPEGWEAPAVRQRLAQAEEERDRRLLAERASQRAGDLRGGLERIRRDMDRARARVQELAESLGLAPDLPQLRLVEAAARVRGWIGARETVARLEGTLEQSEEILTAGLEDLAVWLEPLGYPAPVDAAEAEAAIDELTKRIERLDELLAAIDRLKEDLARAERRAAAARQALDAFWERTGIGTRDEAELRQRLAHLPRHRKLMEQLKDQRAVARDHEIHLNQDEAWSKLGLDPEALSGTRAQELAEEHAVAAASYDELVQEITDIEKDIERAGDATELEEARAAVERAARELAEHRDRAMELTLARLLVRRAGEEQQRSNAPRILERAQHWFAAFTREAFHLEVGRDGTLAATDTRLGAHRSLEELSDGTRIHLLLAARLAALEEAEGTAGPMPLFLDEALSTTDPGRFQEIASALLALVREGRQLLYLSADPTEIAHWQEACQGAGIEPPEPLQLGLPSASLDGWTAVPSLDAGAVPRIPAPGESDAIAYAQKLGVPPPDPWRPASAWHVLHLLPDRLPLVARLLRLGFPETGPLEEALRAGRLAEAIEAGDRALILARTVLLHATLALWRRGRGRPVTWKDVAASGAVSGTFEEKVRHLVDERGRTPEAFLAAIRELRGFRRAKLQILEDHLREAGVLPGESPLAEQEIFARSLERCGPELASAGMAPEDAIAYVRALLRLLEPSGS